MSMELLAMPYLVQPDGYYSPDEARVAWLEHFEDVLTSLTHIASVDAFQAWIYTHPEGADAAARDAAWLDIRARFEPVVDWSGLESERMARWYRQLHIFELPFYYIEYGLAQLGALQVFRNAVRNGPEAHRGVQALPGARWHASAAGAVRRGGCEAGVRHRDHAGAAWRFQGMQPMPADQAKDLAEPSPDGAAFLDPSRYAKATVVGKETFEGVESWKLSLVSKSGREVTEYFDVNTGLRVGTVTSTPMGAQTALYQDYKEFEKKLVATKIVQRSGQGDVILTSQIVTFGPPDAAYFKQPQ
jgi:hypothetical protein